VRLREEFPQATVELGGKREVLQFFCMRSMVSGAAFYCAFRRQTQQSFLEGHERAFAYFGEVFELLRYDNLALAVRKILKGRQRLQTRLFYAFQAHWGCKVKYFNPGEGHEKGGVEGENGWLGAGITEATGGGRLQRQFAAASLRGPVADATSPRPWLCGIWPSRRSWRRDLRSCCPN